MRPLRYSINITLDGCCDHTAVSPGQEVHQHAADWLARADLGLFGRLTYELMEAWRPNADGELDDWIEPWMMPFADTIGAMPKVVVSSTLGPSDLGWNAEAVAPPDLVSMVRELKEQPGAGIALGGLTLARPLAEAGLVDEYQLVVHPRIVGRGPRIFDGLVEHLDLRLVDRTELPAGVSALTYVPV